jgi:hypothetical protein
VAGDEYIWEGNSYEPFAGNTSGIWAWSDVDDWMSSSYPASQPPGPLDTVIFNGLYVGPPIPHQGIPDGFAYVAGDGAAAVGVIDGYTELNGDFTFGAVDYEGLLDVGLVVEFGGSLIVDDSVTVGGDLDFNNSHETVGGPSDALSVIGVAVVKGTLGATFATTVNIGGHGQLTVGSVAPDGTVTAGDDSVTLDVDDEGSFIDRGGFSNGSISAEDDATVTIDAAASVSAVTAVGGSTVRLAAIQAGLSTQYDVGAEAAIGIGEAAAAGQFALAGDLVTSGGDITAPLVIIDGTLESTGAEIIDGELDDNGALQIDANATASLKGLTNASTTGAIVFNGVGGVLSLSGKALSTTSFAPTMQSFAATDSIVLTGFASAQIAEEAVSGGDLDVTLEGQFAGGYATYQLTFAGLGIGEVQVTSSGGVSSQLEVSSASASAYLWTGGGATNGWSDPANWAAVTAGDPASAAPDPDDFVTIAGAAATPASIGGSGQAHSLTLSGFVDLSGEVTAGVVNAQANASATVESSATLTVNDDLAAASGATLTVSGKLNVDGASAVTSSDVIDVQGGAMTTGSIVAAGQGGATTDATYNITDGSLTVTGALTSLGDTITVDDSQLSVSGEATLGGDALAAIDGAMVTLLESAAVSANTFTVDAASSIELGGAAAAAAGTFWLASGRFSGSGVITAPSIVIDGRLVVNPGEAETLNGALSGAGEVEIDDGALTLAGDPSHTSSIVFDGGGALSIAPAAIDDAGAFAPTIQGFGQGDTVDLMGLVGGAIESQVASGGETLVTLRGMVGGVSATEQLTFDSASLAGMLSSDGGAAGTLVEMSVACFARGARILTDQGEVAVEDLCIGNLVVTAAGALRPVRWIGHRKVNLSRHPYPAAVLPVRVCRGAFGDELPHCDLWLSPGHNVAYDGVLIPISALINGVSVAAIDMDWIEYWHVELDSHDILFAEGLPAESYLDCGNRSAFSNGGAFIDAHPDFAPKHWADTCLPLRTAGPRVVAAKACLLARLAERGYCVVHDADAHIIADGMRIEAVERAERRLAFALPAGCQEITLRSNEFIPAHTMAESMDGRELGLSVRRLRIDDLDAALASPDYSELGWHQAEFNDGRFDHRWTTGMTPLPAGAESVIVDLAGVGHYRRRSEERAPALPAPAAAKPDGAV